MSRFVSSCAAVGLLAGIGISSLPAGAQTPTHCEPDVGSPANLKTIKHGLLEGYLPPDSVPDSLKLLPPPPRQGSLAYDLDVANAESTFPLQGSPRWEVAAIDANLHFPEAAAIYSCTLGIPITKDGTPRLYTLLQRTLSDAGLATYKAKNNYQRSRLNDWRALGC